ncbi:hypothetical protein VULLAG_LOCUS7706 [Vulpes lagopus]
MHLPPRLPESDTPFARGRVDVGAGKCASPPTCAWGPTALSSPRKAGDTSDVPRRAARPRHRGAGRWAPGDRAGRARPLLNEGLQARRWTEMASGVFPEGPLARGNHVLLRC